MKGVSVGSGVGDGVNVRVRVRVTVGVLVGRGVLVADGGRNVGVKLGVHDGGSGVGVKLGVPVGRGVTEIIAVLVAGAVGVSVASGVGVNVSVAGAVRVAVLVRRMMGVCDGTLATSVLPGVEVGDGATVGVTWGRPRPHPARINVRTMMTPRRIVLPLCSIACCHYNVAMQIRFNACSTGAVRRR